MQSPTGQLYCDFCGKGEEDCSHIIVSGPDQQGVAICSACILMCVDVIFQRAGVTLLPRQSAAKPNSRWDDGQDITGIRK